MTSATLNDKTLQEQKSMHPEMHNDHFDLAGVLKL